MKKAYILWKGLSNQEYFNERDEIHLVFASEESLIEYIKHYISDQAFELSKEGFVRFPIDEEYTEKKDIVYARTNNNELLYYYYESFDMI